MQWSGGWQPHEGHAVQPVLGVQVLADVVVADEGLMHGSQREVEAVERAPQERGV